MGLDITCYSGLKWIEPQPEGDDLYDAGVYIFDNEHFPGQAEPFKTGAYQGEEFMGFRAGSYSGYNQWREWLCKTMLGVTSKEIWENPEAYEGQPFVELINFSDCEGTLGTVVCAKLAKDFEDHIHKFDVEVDPDSYDRSAELYETWAECFRHAADNNGVICFH